MRGDIGILPCRKLTMRAQPYAVLSGPVGADDIATFPAAPRRCRPTSFAAAGASPFRRGNPGSVPFWHVMPWSLHFAARKRKSAKKRGRRPGENPCRRAPTPSPPTLTLSVPIHFDSPIKEIPCLRTLPIHLPTSAPPGHNGKHPRMAPKEPTRLSSNACIPISPVWLRRV